MNNSSLKTLLPKEEITVIKRGDIVWIDFGQLEEPETSSGNEINGKLRPAIIISYDGQNAKGKRVIILPTSSRTLPLLSFELFVGKVVLDDPQKRETKILCEQIRSIDKNKLWRKSGELPAEWLEKIDEKLQKILDLRKKRLSCLVCGTKTREIWQKKTICSVDCMKNFVNSPYY